MSNKFGKNSLVYTVTTIFQKGVSFFLIPIYSVYINPKEYGVISLVLAIVAILTVFFTLAFDSAIVRFYYDFRHDEVELRKKIGTLLTSLVANTTVVFSLCLTLGPPLFKLFLPNVAFYPYIFLGLLIVVFQPFYLLVLGFCQTVENAKAFSILSIGYFLTHLMLTLTLVVGFESGGVGILIATVVSSFLFSIIGLYHLRAFFTVAFEFSFFKEALRYTLPLIPHALAGQLAVTVDRFLINGYLNTKATGIYYMGFQLSYPVDVVSNSFNRAFVPSYFNFVEDKEGRVTIKENASVFFAICLLVAFSLSIWAPEVFKYLLDEAYLESLMLLPIISFSFVATTIYYIHSCIFFYKKQKIYLVAVCTITANLLNLGLNILAIPSYGIYGAAYATLVSQVALAILAAVIGSKWDKVSWPTSTYFLLFLLLFAVSALTNQFVDFSLLFSFFIRAIITCIIFILVSMILWKSPLAIITRVLNIKKIKP